jgi:hypothetical protein
MFSDILSSAVCISTLIFTVSPVFERMPMIPEAVAENALAHKIPDKVARAYQRSRFLEMRRTLLDAWGQYVAGESGKVVHLPLGLTG